MQRSFKQHEATNQLVELFATKAEIHSREGYYKRVLQTCSDMLTALGEKIEKTTDVLEKTRLEREFQDTELTIETTKNYYEHWNGRKKEHEIAFASMQNECNTHFDFVFGEAEMLAKIQPRLAGVMQNWAKEKEMDHAPEDAAQQKVDFYMFMKKELENHYEHKKNKEFKLPKIETPLNPAAEQNINASSENKEQSSTLHKVD